MKFWKITEKVLESKKFWKIYEKVLENWEKSSGKLREKFWKTKKKVLENLEVSSGKPKLEFSALVAPQAKIFGIHDDIFRNITSSGKHQKSSGKSWKKFWKKVLEKIRKSSGKPLVIKKEHLESEKFWKIESKFWKINSKFWKASSGKVLKGGGNFVTSPR